MLVSRELFLTRSLLRSKCTCDNDNSTDKSKRVATVNLWGLQSSSSEALRRAPQWLRVYFDFIRNEKLEQRPTTGRKSMASAAMVRPSRPPPPHSGGRPPPPPPKPQAKVNVESKSVQHKRVPPPAPALATKRAKLGVAVSLMAPVEMRDWRSAFDQKHQVGQGTYGSVFVAQDRQSREIVALKRINTAQEANGFPITALREVKILKALNHVNIVNLKEIVTSRGT